MEEKTKDKILYGVIAGLLIILVGLIFSMHIANIKPHEEVYYVVGYHKRYYVPTNVPMTEVTVSYNVIGLDSGGGVVTETKTIYYGGHYDFKIGHLYKVHSEGMLGWVMRKITMTETPP